MSTNPIEENIRIPDIHALQKAAGTREHHESFMQLSPEDYLNTILKQWFNAMEITHCRKCRPEMFGIRALKSHLLVELKADFCFGTIRTILHLLTSLPHYFGMNDIWLIGKHHTLMSMSDIEELVADFRCLCSRCPSRKKTAVVVSEGQTALRLQLMTEGIDRQLPFECRLFHTLAEAESWIGVAEPKVA